jgi:hypothetical protein
MILTEEDEHEIMFYSLRHSSAVSLREMYQFGKQAQSKQTILIAAQYLHEELPIRLARCLENRQRANIPALCLMHLKQACS